MGSLSLQRLCMVGSLELVLVLSLLHGSFAQNNNCSQSTLTPLSACLPYIQPGNTSKPGSDCCNPLQTLFTSGDATCLCQFASLGISFNETRALDVANLCNQTVPENVKSCLGSQAPVGAPSSTPTSPSTPTPPAQTGSDNNSLGSNLTPPSLLLIGSIFVALLLHVGVIST